MSEPPQHRNDPPSKDAPNSHPLTTTTVPSYNEETQKPPQQSDSFSSSHSPPPAPKSSSNPTANTTTTTAGGTGKSKKGLIPPPQALALEPNAAGRYKTALCRSVAKGKKCHYGHWCMFAHSQEELRQPAVVNLPTASLSNQGQPPYQHSSPGVPAPTGAVQSQHHQNYYHGAPIVLSNQDPPRSVPPSLVSQSNSMMPLQPPGPPLNPNQNFIQHRAGAGLGSASIATGSLIQGSGNVHPPGVQYPPVSITSHPPGQTHPERLSPMTEQRSLPDGDASVEIRPTSFLNNDDSSSQLSAGSPASQSPAKMPLVPLMHPGSNLATFSRPAGPVTAPEQLGSRSTAAFSHSSSHDGYSSINIPTRQFMPSQRQQASDKTTKVKETDEKEMNNI